MRLASVLVHRDRRSQRLSGGEHGLDPGLFSCCAPLAMPRMPRVTGVDVLRALMRAGWYHVDQEGSHVHLKHPNRPGRVTVPIHRGQTLGPRLLGSIAKQAGLTTDELGNLL